MSRWGSRSTSCCCGNSTWTRAKVTEISIPISSDSLARPSGHLDCGSPTFSAQRGPGWRLGPVSARLSVRFSLRASTALSIFVERAAAACVVDSRTILGARGGERIRTFSSRSTRLGPSSDPRVHSCESSPRIGTGSSFSLDFASLSLDTSQTTRLSRESSPKVTTSRGPSCCAVEFSSSSWARFGNPSPWTGRTS